VEELRMGQKRTHWMWFVFPQVEGLGRSAVSQRFAIEGRDHALAYLGHPVLGARLEECTLLALEHAEASAEALFGTPDWLKFRSCMTLFAEVEPQGSCFEQALEAFFSGQRCGRTLELLD
jgi:uncharacterized protein (DUF1810 family)